MLGAQPATAGYATWTVQPHPGDLSWAEGSVPTPHGNIGVDWAGQSGTGQFSMKVTAPSGTTGTIAVPTYGADQPDHHGQRRRGLERRHVHRHQRHHRRFAPTPITST